jgi:organic hydroperoxide reductase OsmC/OhrA
MAPLRAGGGTPRAAGKMHHVPNPKSFQYDVAVAWDGRRASSLSTAGRPTIQSGPPTDFPMGEDDRWSPEHLFLGSLASCTMISFLAHAEHKGVDVIDYASEIGGTVMRRVEDGRYAFVHVHQRPRVVVAAGQAEQARELIGKAERDCFISASTTAEIQNDWEITER